MRVPISCMDLKLLRRTKFRVFTGKASAKTWGWHGETSTVRLAVPHHPAGARTVRAVVGHGPGQGLMPSNFAAVSPSIARRSSSVKPGALRM